MKRLTRLLDSCTSPKYIMDYHSHLWLYCEYAIEDFRENWVFPKVPLKDNSYTYRHGDFLIEFRVVDYDENDFVNLKISIDDGDEVNLGNLTYHFEGDNMIVNGLYTDWPDNWVDDVPHIQIANRVRNDFIINLNKKFRDMVD